MEQNKINELNNSAFITFVMLNIFVNLAIIYMNFKISTIKIDYTVKKELPIIDQGCLGTIIFDKK
jgi:hypothetical protein